MNLLLFRSGWVLIGIALVIIFFQILPPRLSDSAWQLTLIAALLNNCMTLLVGSVLVCYSTRRENLDPKSIQQAKLLRTVSAWLSLFLLLLVPVGFIAATSIAKTNYYDGIASMRKLQKVIENIRGTKTEQEFRDLLSRFPGVPQLPAKLDLPFQVFRDSIVQDLGSKRAANINQLEKIRDQNLQIGFKEGFRNTASLILFSFGLMTVALSDSSQRNVITSLSSLLGKLRVGSLWFASSKSRKQAVVNPAWNDNDRKSK